MKKTDYRAFAKSVSILLALFVVTLVYRVLVDYVETKEVNYPAIIFMLLAGFSFVSYLKGSRLSDEELKEFELDDENEKERMKQRARFRLITNILIVGIIVSMASELYKRISQ
tara:strand:- start:259 stop:597 length:339 start_codon:yes stop_codon:yes gene_type:complete